MKPSTFFKTILANSKYCSLIHDFFFTYHNACLDMRENEDFVTVINWVRERIDEVEAKSGVVAYPKGYPFTYWQQYISIRFWLFLSLGAVIVAVFLVISLMLLNPWAALIMVSWLKA